MRWKLSNTILVAMIIATLGAPALAVPYQWLYTGTNSWNSGTNWLNLTNPLDFFTFPDGTNDSALITGAGAPDPNLVSGRTIGQLTLANDGDLFLNNFTLIVNVGAGTNGTTLVGGLGSDLNVEQGVLDTDTLRVNTDGEVDIRGGRVQIDITGDLNSGGLVNGFGVLEKAGSTALVNDGRILASAGTLTIRRAGGSSNFDWDGSGTTSELEVAAGATMLITIPTAGDRYSDTIDLNGGTFNVTNAWGMDGNSAMEMNGSNIVTGAAWDMVGATTINVNAGSNAISSSGFTATSGAIVVDPGATLTISSASKTLNSATAYTANGTLRLSGSSTINGGVFNGTGTFQFSGGTATINGNTTVNTTTFDWDGATTNLTAGSALVINSNTLDIGNNQYDNVANLASGSTLNVAVAATEWTNSGTVNMAGANIFGDKMGVGGAAGAGNLNANSGVNNMNVFLDVDNNGNVTVANGATLNLNKASRFEAGADVAINGTLIQDFGLTFAGPNPITGTGTIRNNGNWIFTGSTTINTTSMDLDGAQGGGSITTINSGNVVTFNSKVIETDAGNIFNGIINLNSSTLAINTTNVTPVAGTISILNSGGGTPILNGTGINVLNTGEIRINGTATINAPVTLQTGGQIRALTNGTLLTTNGLLTLNGGTYVEDFPSTYRPNGNIDVTENSSINVTTLDWDFAETTDIAANKKLTLNVGTVDAGNDVFNGGDINLNGGDLEVNNTANLWNLGAGATLNIKAGGTVSGAALDVSTVSSVINVDGGGSFTGPTLNLINGDVNGTGGGSFIVSSAQLNIASPVTIDVAAGTQFRFTGTDADISGGTYTGDGTLQIVGSGGTTTILEDTTVDTKVLNWDGGGGDFTVNASKTFTINSDEIDDIGEVFDSGKITLGNAAKLAVNTTGPWTLGSTAEIDMAANSEISGSQLIVRGPITDLGGGNRPKIFAPVNFAPTGSLTVPAGNVFELHGVTTFSGGTLTGPGQVEQRANATVVSDTTIDIGTYDWDFGANNVLTVNTGATFTVNSNTGLFGGDDTMVINDKASLLVNGPTQASWTNAGLIDMNGLAVPVPLAFIGGTDNIINTGTITGNGTFGVNVTNNGTVIPGASPGILRFNQNYTQGAASRLRMQIAGTTPIVRYDVVSVGNLALLNGQLRIEPIAPYVAPNVRGTQHGFKLVQAGVRAGNFAQVFYNNALLVPDFGPDANGSFRDHVGNGRFLRVHYTGSQVQFFNLFALGGDTDGDKDVDISDFNTLAGNFDPGGANAPNSWLVGNFDGDNDVDIADFNTLATNFSPGGYDAASAVAAASADANPGEVDLIVDLANGEVILDGNNAAISGLQIFSAGNSLLATDFTADVLQFVISTNTSTYAEGAFANMGVDGQISLGMMYDALVDARDVTFEYTMIGQPTVQGTVAYIPEPASLVLMGMGSLLVLRRRRAA